MTFSPAWALAEHFIMIDFLLWGFGMECLHAATYGAVWPPRCSRAVVWSQHGPIGSRARAFLIWQLLRLKALDTLVYLLDTLVYPGLASSKWPTPRIVQLFSQQVVTACWEFRKPSGNAHVMGAAVQFSGCHLPPLAGSVSHSLGNQPKRRWLCADQQDEPCWWGGRSQSLSQGHTTLVVCDRESE